MRFFRLYNNHVLSYLKDLFTSYRHLEQLRDTVEYYDMECRQQPDSEAIYKEVHADIERWTPYVMQRKAPPRLPKPRLVKDEPLTHRWCLRAIMRVWHPLEERPFWRRLANVCRVHRVITLIREDIGVELEQMLDMLTVLVKSTSPQEQESLISTLLDHAMAMTNRLMDDPRVFERWVAALNEVLLRTEGEAPIESMTLFHQFMQRNGFVDPEDSTQPSAPAAPDAVPDDDAKDERQLTTTTTTLESSMYAKPTAAEQAELRQHITNLVSRLRGNESVRDMLPEAAITLLEDTTRIRGYFDTVLGFVRSTNPDLESRVPLETWFDRIEHLRKRLLRK